MNVCRKRAMVEPSHRRLLISTQRSLLRINRSYNYCLPVPDTDETLALVTVIRSICTRVARESADRSLST